MLCHGRAVLVGLFLVTLAVSSTFAAARKPEAPNTEALLRTMKPGVTTRAQVEQNLGQPQKSESTPEGLTLYTYAAATKGGSKTGDNVSGLATMAGMGSWLMPTQMGIVTAGVSAVAGAGGTAMKVGSKKSGGTGDAFYVVFDRDGRLARWKGVTGGREVSSSDHGGIPLLPQQTIDQAATLQQPSADDPAMPATAATARGAHLGLHILPIEAITGNAAIADLNAAGIVGFYVVNALPGQPGTVAGLQPNDLVYLIDGTLITNVADLNRTLARLHPGDAVAVRFYRNDPATGRWNEIITQVKF